VKKTGNENKYMRKKGTQKEKQGIRSYKSLA
jgi:hypothetical protein